jgi:hypothetical protein
VGLRARRLRTCPIAQARQHSQPRGGRLLVRASGSQRVCWRTYDRRAELSVWSCRVRRSAAARAASFSPRPGDRVTPIAAATPWLLLEHGRGSATISALTRWRARRAASRSSPRAVSRGAPGLPRLRIACSPISWILASASPTWTPPFGRIRASARRGAGACIRSKAQAGPSRQRPLLNRWIHADHKPVRCGLPLAGYRQLPSRASTRSCRPVSRGC